MARIPPEDIEAVRTNVPAAEVIGEHVALKPAGASLKGLCPFHQEKTPSFTVNKTTNLWHCFGCGEGSDVIGFIQQIEGESFRWAVQYLADRYNIPIHFTEDDTANATRKSRLIEAHELAAAAYRHSLLTDPEGEPARALLTGRGFDVQEAADRFGCGYSPAHRSVAALLESKGFTREEITEAGLATTTRNGTLRDRFQGRLTWTIRDTFGKPIGFGARRLRDSDRESAKFINTTETPIYRKSQVLYGFDVARKDIARLRQAVVVEGYTDVMAMHLAGITNAVASCGTAFTADHLHTLRRLVGEAGEIVFAFDDDNAGQKAARETYRQANKLLRRLSALPHTDGLDPDELRQHSGDEALRTALSNRIPLSEAVIRLVIEQMPKDTPEDRVAALDAVLPYLNDITDPLIRHEYATMVGTLLRFSPTQVAARLSAPADLEDRGATASNSPDATVSSRWLEREALQVLAQNEALAAEHLNGWDIDQRFLEAPSLAALDLLRAALSVPPGESAAPWPMRIMAAASTDEEKSLAVALTANSLPVAPEDATPYLAELLARLDAQGHRKTVEGLRAKITSATTREERESALKQLMAVQRQASASHQNGSTR